MTTKAIIEALSLGRVVTLRSDPAHRICRDLFGGLVVVSLNPGEPTRKATVSDKRKAVIYDNQDNKDNN